MSTREDRSTGGLSLVLLIAESSTAGFVSLLAVTMSVAALVKPEPSSSLLLVTGIAWFGSALGLLATVATWLLRGRRERGTPRPNLLQFFFQAARVCLALLVLGALVSTTMPRQAQGPLFAPWVLLLLGFGFWGFVLCIMAYYYFGGEIRVQRLLFRIFTALAV